MLVVGDHMCQIGVGSVSDPENDLFPIHVIYKFRDTDSKDEWSAGL